MTAHPHSECIAFATLALATVALPKSVGLIEFVTALAVSLSSLASASDRRTVTAHGVFSAGDWLHVLRVNATANTAKVIDLETFRYRSDENLVRQPMSERWLPICSWLSGFYLKLPISTWLAASRPKPTSAVRLGRNELHESVDGTLIVGHCDSSKVAMFRAAQRVNAVAARPTNYSVAVLA